MRPIWVVFTLASTAACWIAYFVADRDVLLWAVVSTLLGLVLVPLAFWVLPGYVRTKATYYAESFFGTLSAVDRASWRIGVITPDRTTERCRRSWSCEAVAGENAMAIGERMTRSNRVGTSRNGLMGSCGMSPRSG